MIMDSWHYVCTLFYKISTESDFTFHAERVTYEDAKLACATEGRMLVMPKTEAQHDLLDTFLDSLPSRVDIFIGLTDAITEDEFQWEDGSVLSWNDRWNTNEPNNYGGQEDCVKLRPDNKWNDVVCRQKFAFVCQKGKSIGGSIDVSILLHM